MSETTSALARLSEVIDDLLNPNDPTHYDEETVSGALAFNATRKDGTSDAALAAYITEAFITPLEKFMEDDK